MWFDGLFEKEKIDFLFDGELGIENSTLEYLVFSDICQVTMIFYSDGIPQKIPIKWRQRGYNSVLIGLNFTRVRNIQITGGDIGFRCNPKFSKSDYGLAISVSSKCFKMNFEAESGAISRLEGIIL